jgi:hypothetical protein
MAGFRDCAADICEIPMSWGGEGRRRVQVELDGEAVDRQSHWNVFAPYHAGSKESRDSLGLDNDLDE